MNDISHQIAHRRTFAIIAHPDAGKTTLTEKLLLFGGAIQLAGAVKAKGDARRAHSDWMKVERERGISVATSVMTFNYQNCTFNLLDTPGHQDFSEDTYRTLTAVDSAVMVLDAARGIQEQTRKLFEVCRLRDVPIVTFINKMDREGREPFDLLDEIEQSLALDVTPASWPIGMGRRFKGCYDLFTDKLILMDKSDKNIVGKVEVCSGLSDDKLDQMLGNDANILRDEIEMAQGLCPEFDPAAYREGHMTPVYFGSAINNFGVRELLAGLAKLAPPPGPRPSTTRPIEPDEPSVSGFVFKIQANMDPKHRDRMAFMRVCSGHFRRGMKLKHVRSGKQINMHNPVLFLAQDRGTAEEAYAGDIIGLPNHGNLHIGDALSEGENLAFTGIPSFAPELLQRVAPDDPMKAKHLGRALQQLAEEGAASVFRPRSGANWYVGVVGALQFDILADRIASEYELPVHFEASNLYTARWVQTPDEALLKRFAEKEHSVVADDHEGDLVLLARNAWHLDDLAGDWPDLTFAATKDQSAGP